MSSDIKFGSGIKYSDLFKRVEVTYYVVNFKIMKTRECNTSSLFIWFYEPFACKYVPPIVRHERKTRFKWALLIRLPPSQSSQPVSPYCHRHCHHYFSYLYLFHYFLFIHLSRMLLSSQPPHQAQPRRPSAPLCKWMDAAESFEVPTFKGELVGLGCANDS